jgi:hypothetical protein
MTTTGYTETFNRTVAGSFGTATSGQPYSLFGSGFSVAPSTGSIAIGSAGDKFAFFDMQTANVDITAQVALSAIPATNLATVGFVSKLSTTSNYYNATMMVATGGAISLRFSKVISGGLVTIATFPTGLTYVANTFYNLRYSIYWSNQLQTNVMSLKLWAVGATQPGGWTAQTTDNAITQYASGAQVGLLGRDESTAVGSITAKFQNAASTSYALPMPAATDPMCNDPAVAFPDQTALQSLAVAADAKIATNDPLVSLAANFPRVRISSTGVTLPSSGPDISFTTTEFNVGTPTDLGQDAQALYLPVGIWLTFFEIQLAEAASQSGGIATTDSSGPSAGKTNGKMRSNPAQSLDFGMGGSGHISALTYSTDPVNPVRYTAFFNMSGSATYTVKYMALSAIKISDYFA